MRAQWIMLLNLSTVHESYKWFCQFSVFCRIYNSLQPAKPYQTLVLNKISAYSSALGESFVSMDFGSPENQSWPLYLLTGMGDVFLIQHKFSSALYVAMILLSVITKL